jgi:hypothetical protein
MGTHASKPPFNLAEFLSEKATKRVPKRKFPANARSSENADKDQAEAAPSATRAPPAKQ